MSATGEAPTRGIEARRDQAVELYRSGLSEREVAGRLGVSVTTVHFDLVTRDEPRRPQLAGLRPPTPEQLRALQEGNAGFWARVDRVKVERDLIDVDELLERLRRAGVPRSKEAIQGYVRRGWIEPERGLGFEKPRLYSKASADQLIARLQHPYRDGRLRRWNPTTPERARWRAEMIGKLHGLLAGQREHGRMARFRKRPGPKPKLGPEAEAEIRQLRAHGKSLRQIVNAFEGDVTLKQVRRVLAGPGQLKTRI